MTTRAWVMLGTLAVAVGVALAAGASAGELLLALAVLVLGLCVWGVVGSLIKRDADRLGYDDVGDEAGSKVMFWGLPGLLWWLGYRRGRADARRPAERQRRDL